MTIYLTSILNQMCKLSKTGVPPKRFLDLKDDLHLFASYMFVTSKRLERITKKKISWSIRNDTYNGTGAGVSVDHIQSDHPGLVTQFPEKSQVHAFFCSVNG